MAWLFLILSVALFTAVIVYFVDHWEPNKEDFMTSFNGTNLGYNFIVFGFVIAVGLLIYSIYLFNH